MLLTKESDYAIRIVRALKDGNKIRARDICEEEEIPEAFAYKILKKLERANLVHVSRGTRGGCVLVKDIGELSLYDIVLAIEPEVFHYSLYAGEVQQAYEGISLRRAYGIEADTESAGKRVKIKKPEGDSGKGKRSMIKKMLRMAASFLESGEEK